MAMILAKVWPLEPGVKGNAPHDNSVVTLKCGTPGFMEYEAAKQAEKDGLVQLMAGIGWNDLKTPRTEATKKPEPAKSEPVRNEYRTADLKPSTPRNTAQSDTTQDEQDKGTYNVTEMKPKRSQGRPRKNTDMPQAS